MLKKILKITTKEKIRNPKYPHKLHVPAEFSTLGRLGDFFSAAR